MKKNIDLILNILYIFILNILLSLLIFKSITILNILYFIFESITLGSIIKLVSSISKNNKLNKAITLTFLGIVSVIFAAQFVHYKFYECFFTFYSLINGGQVFSFLEAILKIIKENILGFLSFIIIFIITIPILIKIPFNKKRKNIFIYLVLILISITTMFLSSNLFKIGIYSKYNLLYNTHNHTQNIKNFGLFTSTAIDTVRYYFEFEPKLLKEENNYTYKKGDEKIYNVTDINFETLKNKETNPNLKEFYSYLESKKPTTKNEYTGIFENKNLIFITAESFNFNIIDKELTPTLYKLKNEGITFNNFYTPIYYASTSDGEYTNLTGLLPVEGTWSYIDSQNNYYPYTYSNVFKEKGYKTYSYHNGEYNFYDRNIVQKSFGYDIFKACGNGLEKDINCNLWPQSDKEMFESTFKDYKDNENFMTYYMTISGHLPHNYKTHDIAKKYGKYLENKNYSDSVKAYISANIDLDKGLDSLLKNLEKENLLDDTVIVIVPDHFPYGLTKEELKEIEVMNTDYDLHKSNLIIYNSEIKGKRIDKYSSNIDILPTLLNMFNIKYDSRLITGQDIISDSEGIVIFNNQSFLTKEGYYNSKTNSFSNKETNKQYITNKKIEVYNKINTSRIILKNNIYNKIK